jgi:uncharacterized repeat protein (TIGR01451 family)
MASFRLRTIVLIGLALVVVFLFAHRTAAQSPIPQDPMARSQLPYWQTESNLAPYSTDTVVPQAWLPWSRLVYQSMRDGNWEIYVSHDDGANPIRLTHSNAADIQPRLDRGGARIVNASFTDGNYEIFVMNSDGSGRIRLTHNDSNDVYPVWSPDGGKIAFQSYRDGQAEIYVMNVDGSGVTRLTNHPAYDGYPTWSPDGSKIAFVSTRNDDYHIHIMNADGSDERLVGPAGSIYPAWSPDGGTLAYSCDYDSDGWLEICVMDTNGFNRRMLYMPAGNRDAWVSGWSPDGEGITFTEITLVYHSGAWYWTEAYGLALSVSGSGLLTLSSDNALWNPHWQTLDAIHPNSSIAPLPSISPYRIVLDWSGSDSGGSGIKEYDLQVKVGTGGTWTNWLMNTTDTSADYDGVAGQTYSFRVRARDNAHNVEAWPASPDVVTTIETWPPQTAVYPLPGFNRFSREFDVYWGGYDPGGSGIRDYDVQYRLGAGDWQNWQNHTEATSGMFEPDLSQAGNALCFRSRAGDYAGNQESWPTGDGDACTTIYATAINGVVKDNSGTPIQGITLTTDPASFQTFTGDENGRYASYLATQPATYTAHWSKQGYGPLPATAFTSDTDVHLPIILPPADNVINDSGYETGAFAPYWLPGGSVMPSINAGVRQTGEFSARLSQGAEEFISSFSLGNGCRGAQIIIDNNQVVHAVWVDNNQLLHAQRSVNSWSPPQLITTGEFDYDSILLAADANNTLHLAWVSLFHNIMYYAQRPSGGNWTTPLIVHNSEYYIGDAIMHVTTSGLVHLAWVQASGDRPDVFYKRRDSNGIWTTGRNLSNSSSTISANPRLLTDTQDILHVIWNEVRENGAYGWNSGIMYTQRAVAGAWSTPLNISPLDDTYAFNGQLAVESNGVVHVMWQRHDNDDNLSVYHTYRASGGAWSMPFQVSDGVAWREFTLSLDHADNLHILVWQEGFEPYHIVRSSSAVWSQAAALEPVQGAGRSIMEAMADDRGLVHAVFRDVLSYEVHYSQQATDGSWTSPQHLSGYVSDYTYWQLKADGYGMTHILWMSPDSYASGPIKYAGPAWTATADTITLGQAVSIPITMTAPTLSFLYQGGALVSNAAPCLTLTLDDGATATTIWNPTESNLPWRHQAVAVSAWAGQTVTLTYRLDQAANAPVAWVYLDEVTLGAAHPDLWVAVEGGNGLRNELVTHTLTYGNRGGTVATGVQLTYTLPAELIFVSASLPPISTSPLVWDLDDVAATSEAHTLSVVVQIAPTAAGLVTLDSTAVIHTTAAELETLNNSAYGQTYVGRHNYLPLIMR